MPYAPRTIAFLCDLQHPGPAPPPGPGQKIHNRMFEEGEPLYRSFNVTHEGAVLSNPGTRPDAVSSASFLAHRLLFREEMTGLTVDDFTSRVLEVTKMACELLGVQIFTTQQVTIRTLVNPRHFRDSRTFLKQGVLRLGEEVDDFAREPQLFGMRLVFPADPQHPQVFSLRIESFHSDPRSLWVENQGSFPATFARAGLEPIGANIAATYEFVVQRALKFVANFDASAQP